MTRPGIDADPTIPFEVRWDAAYKRYKGTIRTFARNFNAQIPLMDIEDIEQELLIVLMRCVERYDPNRGASFNTLFQGCAKRECLSMIRHCNTKSRKALVSSLDVEAVAAEVDALFSADTEDRALQRMMLAEYVAENGVEELFRERKGRRRKVA
jgi:DNA-directed RNA polymerase specialized sigma subunit